MSVIATRGHLPSDAANGPATLDGVLPMAAARFGQRPALFFEGQWSTFAELDYDSTRFADGLGQLGVVPGTRVLIHVPNSRDWVIAYYGALKAGAIVVPVDAMLTVDELVFVLSDSKALVLVTGLEDPDAIERVKASVAVSHIVLIWRCTRGLRDPAGRPRCSRPM
jgi:long-chain acyl-CoA synthetase